MNTVTLQSVILTTSGFQEWKEHTNLLQVESVEARTFDIHLSVIPNKKIRISPYYLGTTFKQEMEDRGVEVTSCWISSGSPEGGVIRLVLASEADHG